jgi:hypothetical protein
MCFRIVLKNKVCKHTYTIVVIKQPANKIVEFLGFYDSFSGDARINYIKMILWSGRGAIFSKRVLAIVGNISCIK